MPDMTPLQRAARALCEEMTGKPYDGASASGKKEFEKFARAVIEAIREPSEAMVSTASGIARSDKGRYMHLGYDIGEERRAETVSCWEEMIDALLEEG